MAAISSPLPLSSLCQNIETATKTVGVVLNPQLQVVPGKRYETNLNSVLQAILNRLEDEATNGEQPPQILTTLSHDVTDFVTKITTAKQVARKGTQLDRSLVTKIDIRVQELLNGNRQVCREERQAKGVAELGIYPSLGNRINPKDFVDMVVSESCIFKAVHHIVQADAAYLQYRDKVCANGYHIIFEGGQEHWLVPQKCLELPGPLFLLLCRFSFSSCSQEQHNYSISQRFIPQFLRARLQFPEHTDAINGIIASLRLKESRAILGQRLMALYETIKETQKYCSSGCAGILLSNFAEQFLKKYESFTPLAKDRIRISNQDFASEEEKIAACEPVAEKETEIFAQLGLLFDLAVREHFSSFVQWFNEYLEAYITIQSSSATSKNQNFAPACLPFTPRFRTGIFDKKYGLHSLVPATIPTPEALMTMLNPNTTPPYTDPIEEIIQQWTSQQSDSTPPPDTKEFLPQNVAKWKKPAPKKPSKHKTHPHTAKSGTTQLVQQMEDLTLSKESPAPSPAPDSKPSLAVTPPVKSTQPAPSISPLRPAPSPAPDTKTPPSPKVEVPVEPIPPAPSISRLRPAPAPTLEERGPRFSFHEGSGPVSEFLFKLRVYRWFENPDSIFQYDHGYNQRKYTEDEKASLILKHTVGLALIPVLLEGGKEFVQKDDKGRIRHSYTLAADAIWTDGTQRFERGILTVARDQKSRAFFHLFFSKRNPREMFNQYTKMGFFPADASELPEQMPEKADTTLRLPDDNSRVEKIYEYGVDVIDPKNRVRFKAYFG